MNLAEYISNPARRDQLREAVGANAQYLWQISVSWRGKRASRLMAIAIERATNGVVRKESLRPDIWPELSKRPKAKAA